MLNREKLKPGSKKTKSKHGWKAVVIALYITFLLLSTIPFTADRTIEPEMKEKYEYHLTYPRDGRQTHYYVERVNTSQIGKIDLTYTTSSNSLVVDSENIKVLHVFCRSMYEDECKKVYGIDPSDNSNYYKWYFIEKNHFNVNIDSDHVYEELRFIDTPLAYKVVVNGETWTEGGDYTYNIDPSGIALSDVPEGRTRVDLYFKPDSGIPPTAKLSASKTIVPLNHTIMFDGSSSFDADGSISAYIFDFGDGTFRGGSKQTYFYSKPGVFGVILTVRDNDNLIDQAYLNITVVETSNIPEIQDIVPDQEEIEDAPPWSLNLNTYEPVASEPGIEFYWYITGENTSLYTIAGENSTDDTLIFTPVPDAYGSDLVTLVLISTENISVSQPLWINITPVNDPPTISGLPDLIVHYDDPYIFDYEPYVDDKETMVNELSLEIFDGYAEGYIAINGLKATYNYPQKLVGENIYATVMVSDGEDIAQDLISIQVTSDYVPEVVKSLPDIWLFEGTTKYNVFDLDDYFTDPDNDAIYFSYGQSNLQITINPDHTVDITAASEWTGSELVTFRARDPIGAIAEDSLIVTVLPINDPPVIANVPDLYIHHDHDYRFDLSPYVNDNDNSTDDLTMIVSDPEHIRLDIRNNMVITLNYPATFLGQSVKVMLTVSDGLDTAFQNITVTITEDFPPELLTPLPDIVFLEDEPRENAFDLDNYFLDVDGDVLYYTTGNIYIDITINTDHTVDFSAPTDWFGVEEVYFRATDPTGALQEDKVTVTVLPVNDAPELQTIPAQFGNESERWVLDLKPYISDVDNNISELEISVDNEIVVVSGSKLIFLGSPDMPKEVRVTVSDGEYDVEQTIEVHLRLNKHPQAATLLDLFMNILPFLIIIILIILVIAAVVYRKKNRFTAEEVFLIHTGGTLINHLLRHNKANVDDVIFSGMFTAVQEFIRDTFASDSKAGSAEENTWVLDELKLGDNKILIERSEHTYLAVIFSGEGSKRLRRIVTRLLDKIEDKYSDILPTWDGNIRALAGTKEILSVLIKAEKEPSSSKIKPEIKRAPALPPAQPTYPQQIQPQLQPQPRPVVTSAQPRRVVSSSLTMAQPVRKAKVKPRSKDLLIYTDNGSGKSRPGLTAWSLKGRRNKGRNNFEMNKLPIALHISPHRQFPKTISINKDRIMIDDKSLHLAKPAPSGLNSSQMEKPINITMPNSGKVFQLDPNQSLLQQLAAMDDEGDS